MSNVYEESRDMLIAKLRSLARQGKLEDVDAHQIMSLPLSPAHMSHITLKYKALFQKKGDDEAEWYLGELKNVRQHSGDEESGSTTRSAVRVVVFDDDNPDLTYGISVNTRRERIVVGFRGSVTTRDFLTDANTLLHMIPDPINIETPSSLIGIHTGFYNYLLGETEQHAPKLNDIVSHLYVMREQYPGFRIYCTGHSLGGAIATLAVFTIAASLPHEQRVTCISFGSPKVGDLAFRRAFQELERQGRIQCLRVANTGDAVTLTPDYASLCLRIPDCSCLTCLGVWMYLFCRQSKLYRHVGMHLKLKQGQRYSLRQAPTSTWNCFIYCRDFCRKTIRAIHSWVMLPLVCLCCCTCARKYRDPWGCNIFSHHSAGEYMERLKGVKGELEAKALDAMYDKWNQKQKKG